MSEVDSTSAPAVDGPILQRLRLGGRMVAAWIALVAMLFAIARLFSLFVLGFFDVLGLLVVLAVLGLGTWWSITGNRVKRRIGVAVAVVSGLVAVACVIGFIVEWPRQVLSLIAFLTLFGFFSARALDLGSSYQRWRESRITLPAGADKTSVPLEQVTVPCGLIVNEKSGGGKAEQINLAHRAKRMGIHVEVLQPGDDLLDLADELVRGGAEVIGMAGGDGSLGLVASVAMKHDVPFVCVPVGTRNHFARDLGLNRSDPLAALTGFYGHEVRVDVGLINGRTFLNNASFGVYADMVHEPGYREAKLETGQNLVSELMSGERQPLPLHFRGPGGEEFLSAFLILVAVGLYEMTTIADLGVRASLEAGELQITVLEPADERQLRRLTAAAVLGSLHGQDGFWQWTSGSFAVESPREEVHVGVDGEALTFDSPVEITLRPKALRVLLPDNIQPVPGPQTQPLGATITDLFKLAVGESA